MNDSQIDLRRELEDVRAPDSLRRSVEEMSSRDERPTRRYRWIAAPALVLAAAALILVFMPFGADPSVDSVAARAAAGPNASAPARVGGSELDASVGGTAFPYWEDEEGWSATGQRTEQLDGRSVRTVYYAAPGGGQIRYSIVSGSPIDSAGASYDVTGSGEKRRIVWRRDGHTCVVEAEGVSPAKLESALGLS